MHASSPRHTPDNTSGHPSVKVQALSQPILYGLAAAVLYSLTLYMPLFGNFVGIFAPAPLLLITLRRGRDAGLLAACIAWGGFALAFALHAGNTAPLLHPATISFLARFVIPAVALASLAIHFRTTDAQQRGHYPTQLLLLALTGASLILMFYIKSLGATPPELRELFRQALTSVAGMSASDLPIDRYADIMANLFPAWSSLGWAAGIALNGLLVARLERLRGMYFAPATLPKALTLVLSGALLIASSGMDASMLATNTAIVLLLPFFIVGLAVVHTVAASYSFKNGILILFYGILSFFPSAVVLIALLGMLDTLINCRHYLSKRSS